MTFPHPSIKISMSELVQIRQNESQIWPDDLVDDMEDSDPHVYQQVQFSKELLADKRQELEERQKLTIYPEDVFCEEEGGIRKEILQPKKPQASVFAKDTLVVQGWDNLRIKGTKNWSDFENLMYLYALGKLFTVETMSAKAKQDKDELTYVVEEFDRLKHPKAIKHFTAEKRLASTKTYIDFGKRTIDASCQKNLGARACELHDLEREYMDAEDNNQFNGWKLKKAYHIARRVICVLRQRY